MLLSRWLLHVILAMFGPAGEAPAARESFPLHDTLLFPVEREPARLATSQNGAGIPGEREVDLAHVEAGEIPDAREAPIDVPATREN